MKYLVTGGAGFIGSNLVDKLIEEGHEVIVLDNLSTGKEENINPKAKFVKADFTNLDEIRPHFEGIDGVFHVGALPRVQVSIEDPVSTHEANINGTLNVLLAARDAKVKRLVYSATSSAYGNQDQMPLKEDMLPNPISPYGLQKYIGEHYCRNFSLHYGLETVCLRYFNAYGPRSTVDGGYVMVISVFLKQKKVGQKLTICGDGTQTRDFTYVGDIVRANIMAMTGDKVGKGEVINVGAGNSKSVKEIAEAIGGEVEHLPPRVEPHDTLADISKAKELLGWEPQTSFSEGLQKTIEWFNNNYKE